MIKQDGTVTAVDPGIGGRVVVIEKFLSILANNQYYSLLKGKICHEVMEEGVVQTKFWSGFLLVQKPTETIFFRLREIKRKVMLYPNDGGETFVVLDYSRPTTPHYTPLVPCFPEVHAWCSSGTWRRGGGRVVWGSQICFSKKPNCWGTASYCLCKIARSKPICARQEAADVFWKCSLEQYITSGKGQVAFWELLGVAFMNITLRKTFNLLSTSLHTEH